MCHGVPDIVQVDISIIVHIKVTGILDCPPRDLRVLLLHFIGEHAAQFADLNDAHTARILDHGIGQKSLFVCFDPQKIIRYPRAVA